MPSLADIGAALFSFFGIAVPIVASLYVGTKMAERRIEAALCCLAAFSVLLGGWAIALPTAFAIEKARCPGERGCGMQGDRSDAG
jgi:hypothetical protein